MLVSSAWRSSATRRANALYPHQPASASALNIQPPFTQAGHDDDRLFLLHHENWYAKRASGTQYEATIVIFGTHDMFQRLCNSNTWYMDGTFKCSPDPFPQYFTIHFFIGLRLMPALYCLCHTKLRKFIRKCLTG